MIVKLFITKNINENANFYFNKAKKLKKKIPGILETIEKTKKEIKTFNEEKENYLKNKEIEEKLKFQVKKEWYEKFRWSKTSNGLLFVFGSDSTSNEVLIKKHLNKNDFVFHTQTPGSPFGILINGKINANNEDIFECAQVLCAFSSQWKRGFGVADAFYVSPEQISKKAPSGEYMNKGSFMISGKKNLIKNVPLKLCLGIFEERKKIDGDNEIFLKRGFSGSCNAVKKFCKNYIFLEPGDLKPKKVSDYVKKKFKITINDLPKLIPMGVRISKR